MVAAATTATVATVALGGPLIVPLALGLLPIILQAQGGPLAPARERAPGIRPGDLLRAALSIQALSEAGLVPVASTDPFTGDLVVSTQDQSPILETLLGEKFGRETVAALSEEIVEPQTVRDVVVDRLAMPTAKLVAPGVVSKGSRDLVVSRRLGGPCAGLNTGFSRINCQRGGFA